MRFKTPLALCALLASAAWASAQTPASQDPGSVQAGTYRVESNHTQVLFCVSHMGFSIYSGAFSGAAGTLSLDPKHLR